MFQVDIKSRYIITEFILSIAGYQLYSNTLKNDTALSRDITLISIQIQFFLPKCHESKNTYLNVGISGKIYDDVLNLMVSFGNFSGMNRLLETLFYQ